MNKFEIVRKDNLLMVKKNGEHFSKVAHDKFSTSAEDVYRRLYESNGFVWWAILRDYYRAGAPEKWSGEYES